MGGKPRSQNGPPTNLVGGSTDLRAKNVVLHPYFSLSAFGFCSSATQLSVPTCPLTPLCGSLNWLLVPSRPVFFIVLQSLMQKRILLRGEHITDQLTSSFRFLGFLQRMVDSNSNVSHIPVPVSTAGSQDDECCSPTISGGSQIPHPCLRDLDHALFR